jgi:succinylglutamate desuccinylase
MMGAADRRPGNPHPQPLVSDRRQQWARRWLRSIGLLLLVGLLSACTAVSPFPTHKLVEQAIVLELSQIQQELRQELGLGTEAGAVKLDRVAITEQTPLPIDDLQGFRVRGTCDFTLKLPQRQIVRKQNPFEVHLQRQIENKTWRYARLAAGADGEIDWVTQQLGAD